MGIFSKIFGGNKKLNTSIDISGIELAAEQKALFDKIENTKEHMFINVKAGTGK